MSISEPADPSADADRGGSHHDGIRVPEQRAKTRLTVDLSREQHRQLRSWCTRAADRVGCTSIPQARVIRLLLLRLYDDPDLEEYVVDSLRRENQ